MHPSRRPKYASPDGLGQAFNFDLLEANWNAGEFLRVITDNLSDAQRQGSSTTWVLSNHDVVRHATRYGLPPEDRRSQPNASNWLLSSGTSPRLDRGPGLRRARAAILLMLALPGSAYLYQGEELGLHEVADIPFELRPGPQLRALAGRRRRAATAAGSRCRGRPSGPSFGFGDRWRPPAAAGLVRPAQRRGAGPGSGVDPALYRERPAVAAQAADRGEHGVDAEHQRPGAALRPPWAAGAA